MSTVFLARDLKHDRSVALKVLRPDLASAVGSDRFLREIKLTAALNHPHILPLLDSGAIDGLVYYVMPYVTGGSLRGRLALGEPLSLDEAMRVARQVAAALDYAHRAGVVHRDIKPENILFSEGLAVVADFGVARAVSTVDGQTLTRSGFPVGTLGYMSPEQAAGRTDLDERTDVFSLACVVYEMLVADTPAGWPGEEDARLGRFLEAPPDHRALLDALARRGPRGGGGEKRTGGRRDDAGHPGACGGAGSGVGTRRPCPHHGIGGTGGGRSRDPSRAGA